MPEMNRQRNTTATFYPLAKCWKNLKTTCRKLQATTRSKLGYAFTPPVHLSTAHPSSISSVSPLHNDFSTTSYVSTTTSSTIHSTCRRVSSRYPLARSLASILNRSPCSSSYHRIYCHFWTLSALGSCYPLKGQSYPDLLGEAFVRYGTEGLGEVDDYRKGLLRIVSKPLPRIIHVN